MHKLQIKTDSYFHKFKRDIMRLYDSNISWREPNVNIETSDLFPISSLTEDSKTISLKVELPAVNEEDIIVNLDYDEIKIEVESYNNIKFKNTRNKEQRRFSTKFYLSSLIEPENSAATFTNRILNIKMPKSENKKIN